MPNYVIVQKSDPHGLSHPLIACVPPANAQRFYRVIRRGAEIILCVLGCLPLLALVPLIWLANFICCPGPLFYWQTRVGQHGRFFLMVKFRLMVVNAEANGAVWASADDYRITFVGIFCAKPTWTNCHKSGTC